MVDIVRTVTLLSTENKEFEIPSHALKSSIANQIKLTKNDKSSDLSVLQKLCEGKENQNPGTPKQPKDPNSIMVVIPSVWKLKPDKLTEHQIEKMKERRRDIPALYNDCSSSSMDSVIQPWTPRRIIVPGDTSNDKIIIEDPSLLDNNSLIMKCQTTPVAESEEPFKVPLQNGVKLTNEDLIGKIIEQVKKDSFGSQCKNSPKKNENIEMNNPEKDVKDNSLELVKSSQPMSPMVPRLSKRRRTPNGTEGSQQSLKTSQARKRKTISPSNSSALDDKTNTNKSPDENKKSSEIKKKSPEAKVEPIIIDKEMIAEKIESATQSEKRTSPRKQTVSSTDKIESPKKLVLRIVRKDSPPNQKADQFLVANNVDIEENTELNTDEVSNVQEIPIVNNIIVDDKNEALNEDKQLNDSITSIVMDEQPTNTSTKTIRSSPELSDADEREQDLLNNTMNLSPIPSELPQRRTQNSSTPKLPPTPLLSSPELRRRYTLAHRSSPLPSLNQNNTSSPSTSIVRPNRNFQSNRGRHLINLIQQKPSDVKFNMMNSNKKDFSPEILKNVHDNPMFCASPATPIENKLLTFSKKLPPATASPSISILKRKLDESDIDSPLSKVCGMLFYLYFLFQMTMSILFP